MEAALQVGVEPGTVVFGASDVMAFGAMSAVRDAGRDVGDDIAIAGFGDIETGRDIVPSLTTVSAPLEQLGRAAVAADHRRRLGRTGSARGRGHRARQHPGPMIAVIATSEGLGHRDPWHPFDETSPALASVLAEAGFATRILPVDEALASLDDADLLAVNAGGIRGATIRRPSAPRRPRRAGSAARSPAASACSRCTPLLRRCATIPSGRSRARGGMWVPGISMHPPKSRAAFDWADHPLAGSAPLEAVDERYCMQSFGPRDVVATTSTTA